MSDRDLTESETITFSVNSIELLAIVVVLGLFVAELAGFVPFETAAMVILVLLTISHLVRPYSS